jgi:hypothetical protein
MAKAVSSPTTASVQAVRRPRTSTVLAFGFLALVSALGVDWREGPAMVFGEIMGIAAPVALVALAGLIIHRICNRPTVG